MAGSNVLDRARSCRWHHLPSITRDEAREMNSSSGHSTFVPMGYWVPWGHLLLNNYYPHKITPRKDQGLFPVTSDPIGGSAKFELRFGPLLLLQAM